MHDLTGLLFRPCISGSSAITSCLEFRSACPASDRRILLRVNTAHYVHVCVKIVSPLKRGFPLILSSLRDGSVARATIDDH